MIRSLFGKSDPAQPDLFGSNPPPRRWPLPALLILLLLLPGLFFAGYRLGKSKACDEPAPPIEEKSAAEPGFPAEFVGRYALDVGGHRGFLYVYAAPDGSPAATLQFTNWGKRVPEPLWAVAISARSISFLRACAGARCGEIGASAPFRQVYTGEMQPGNLEIRGTYTGGQSASSWKATRF